jgi:hypothetical protein
MGRTNNIIFIVTKHEIRIFAALGVTRYMSDETGGVSFWQFCEVNGQYSDLLVS